MGGGGLGTWVHAQPIYIAAAAAQFPTVKVVMAHGAFDSWGGETKLIITQLPNVYIDLGMRNMDYKLDPQGFYRWLRMMIDWATPWKILFASDSPSGDTIMPETDWVKVFKEPKTDIRFTKEEMNIILGNAAQAVFNIED